MCRFLQLCLGGGAREEPKTAVADRDVAESLVLLRVAAIPRNVGIGSTVPRSILFEESRAEAGEFVTNSAQRRPHAVHRLEPREPLHGQSAADGCSHVQSESLQAKPVVVNFSQHSIRQRRAQPWLVGLPEVLDAYASIAGRQLPQLRRATAKAPAASVNSVSQ